MDVPKGSTNPNELLKAPDQVNVEKDSEINSKLDGIKKDVEQKYSTLDPTSSVSPNVALQYSQPNTTRINSPQARLNSASSGPPSVPPPHVNNQVNSAKENVTNQARGNVSGHLHSAQENISGHLHSAQENVTGHLRSAEEKLGSQVKSAQEKVSSQVKSALEKVGNHDNSKGNGSGHLNAAQENVTGHLRSAEEKVTNQVKSVQQKVTNHDGTKGNVKSPDNANGSGHLHSVQQNVSGHLHSAQANVSGHLHSAEEKVNNQVKSVQHKVTNHDNSKGNGSGHLHSAQENISGHIHSTQEKLNNQIHSAEEKVTSHINLPHKHKADSTGSGLNSSVSSSGGNTDKQLNTTNSNANKSVNLANVPPSVAGNDGGSTKASVQTNEITRSETLASTAKSVKSAKKPAPVKLVPSEDLDVTNIKTKPPPRQPGQPTFRGWKEVGRWEENDTLTTDDEAVDLLSRTSFFDTYVPPAIIGDWYHNAGYLVVGALLSWIVGWFRFSLAPVFVITLVFSILYRASIRKYRASIREQAQREFSIKKIETDYETMDWLNNFLEKFWFFLEPSIAQIVCDQANPILASSPAPAFIKKLWIDSFSAGTKPPRIDQVKTLHGTNDDIVVMDWGFSFTPNATVDANYKQVKNKVNQKVVVKANVFGFTIPVTVSDVSCRGLVRVRMRMMTSFPHVETINVSFMEPPTFDFSTKLFGESAANWEVLIFPGLYPFINEMVKKYVGPILFTPLSFQLNVQQLLAGNALNSAIGVLVINVKSARGLKGFNTIGNTLDPYLTFSFGTDDILAKTTVKDDTSTPVWNETIYIPVKSLSEPLNIAGIDFNDFRKDRQFGSIKLDLEMLVDNPKQPNVTQPFLRNNKPVGELQFGLSYLPTLEPIRQADGAVTPPPDLNTGIARICVAEGRHLKSVNDKPVSSYAEIEVNGELLKTSSVQKKTNTPGWNSVVEHIVENRAKSKVKVVIKDKENKVIGQVYKSLNELVDAAQVDQTWFPLARGGEVRIETTWKPVELTNVSGSGGYTQPIGVVRVYIEKAEDLRNLETIGKVDPYVRLFVNGVERARTHAFESNLNPTWNEIHYVTVSSANQKLTLEVMDVEPHSTDRTLGSFDVKLSEIITKNETGNYSEYMDSHNRTSTLIHKRGPKGTVTYSLSFFPVLPVMTLEEIKDDAEAKVKAQEAKKKEEEEAAAAAEAAATKKDPKGKSEETPKANEVEAASSEEDLLDSKAKLSLEELIEYKSGVFTYELVEAVVPKDDVYLQFFFDSYGYYNFITPKIQKKGLVKLGLSGDMVIKELDKSSTIIRLSSKKYDNRGDKCISEIVIPTLDLLKKAYNSPATITLSGAYDTKLKLQVGWVPVLYEHGIPPQDSFDNSGILTVKIEKGEDLPSSDSNGYSDPYIELFVNTDSKPFYKTKKQKKTLNPTFNEVCDVELYNKYDAIIRVEAWDWDLAGDNDHLGTGYITLSEFNDDNTDFKVPLYSYEGDDAGFAYFSLQFKPASLINVSANGKVSDSLGSVGAVGSTGKHAVKSVGKLGLGGVGKGAKLFKKGLSLGKSSD